MIKRNVIFLLLLFYAENIVAEDKIYRTCVSESGDSIYDVELNRSLGVGEVRYRIFVRMFFIRLLSFPARPKSLKALRNFNRAGAEK